MDWEEGLKEVMFCERWREGFLETAVVLWVVSGETLLAFVAFSARAFSFHCTETDERQHLSESQCRFHPIYCTLCVKGGGRRGGDQSVSRCTVHYTSNLYLKKQQQIKDV